jgi:hypothetical protein
MAVATDARRVRPGNAHSVASVDWRRLGSRVVVGSLLAIAWVVVCLFIASRGGQWGIDFRGGIWPAGRAVLAGRTPFPAPDAAHLLRQGNAFVTPPLLAVIAVPFSLLPLAIAVPLWNAVCIAALVGALRIVGVRDWRLYCVAVAGFPFVSSLVLGQPDGLFALAAAIAWRWRDSPRGGLAVGVLIAAKLLAWPLMLWLLLTRRVRALAVALASTVLLLGASWAVIGFKGLATYPRLLAADARAFEARSHSILGAVVRAGVASKPAWAIALAVAAAVAIFAVRSAPARDHGWFAAALGFGLLTSPLLWSHYLVLLLVPMAIGRRGPDRLWALYLCLWLSPFEVPPNLPQAWLVLGAIVALAMLASSRGARSTTRNLDVRLVDLPELPVRSRPTQG